MKYSLVIYPGAAIVEYIKEKKNLLEGSIGWFASVNSLAHISICEFETDEVGYKKCSTLVHRLAEFEKEQFVYLSAYKSYPHGTYFIEPAYYSKVYLKEIFRRVVKHIKPYFKDVKDLGNDPHMSIARRLDEDKIKIAKNVLIHIDESFLCNRFALRIFNEQKGQYDIVETIPFGNKNRKDGQLSLFK